MVLVVLVVLVVPATQADKHLERMPHSVVPLSRKRDGGVFDAGIALKRELRLRPPYRIRTGRDALFVRLIEADDVHL